MIWDVEVHQAGEKGLGVFALRAFAPGEFIFRRRHGRRVQNQEIATLSTVDQMHLCELDADTSAIIQPPGCFLNHCCRPNAMRSGVKVFAWSSISMGEEVTIDYRLNATGEDLWECSCGHCPGRIVGSFFGLDADTQGLYLPFAPLFITSEHRRRSSAKSTARAQ